MTHRQFRLVIVVLLASVLNGCKPAAIPSTVPALPEPKENLLHDASRVEHAGLVATIEQLTIKNDAVTIVYQVQYLPTCTWILKPQATGLVRFYNAKSELIDDGVHVSVQLPFARFEQGLSSRMEFTVDFPKDASFVTVWCSVDEFETLLCPLPFPKA
jgi:hypothetical protein